MIRIFNIENKKMQQSFSSHCLSCSQLMPRNWNEFSVPVLLFHWVFLRGTAYCHSLFTMSLNLKHWLPLPHLKSSTCANTKNLVWCFILLLEDSSSKLLIQNFKNFLIDWFFSLCAVSSSCNSFYVEAVSLENWLLPRV